MKSENLECNKFYWSSRLDKMGICEAYTGYMAYMIFVDNKNNGWYHCAELEEIKNNETATFHKKRT